MGTGLSFDDGHSTSGYGSITETLGCRTSGHRSDTITGEWCWWAQVCHLIMDIVVVCTNLALKQWGTELVSTGLSLCNIGALS